MMTPAFFKRSALASSLWGFRNEFFLVGAFSLIANVLMLAPTVYMLQIYDRILVSRSEMTLIGMSILTLLLFAVIAFAEWMRSRVLVRAGLRFDEQLSAKIFNASFEARLLQLGASQTRSFSDLIQIRQFLTGNGIFAFFDAPWTPIYLAVLFFLHPWLGFLGVFFALVQVGIAVFSHRNTLKPTEEAHQSSADTSAFLHSKLRNSEVLESMGMIGNLQERWLQRHSASRNTTSKVLHITHSITAMSKFVRYSQQSLVLGAGALLVIDGQLSPGGMIAANVLMTRALSPIDMIVSGWRQFASMRISFSRLEKLLARFPENSKPATGQTFKGHVTIENLVATATGRQAPILKNISFKIPAGSVVAVLGPSGSGKSTLARALVAIWPTLTGNVLLDGLPLSSWSREELGPHIGYLPQDVELFDGSIADNISRFGEINSEKVIAAAQSAGLHEMILHYPKGYDTSIGEAGHLLSGGQRQRIGLARALYGDPMLIVLDEPNANLDDVGEAALYDAVRKLKARGSTVFVVSHRSGAVAQADHVVLLNDGSLYTAGPRDAVLAALRDTQTAASHKEREAKPMDSLTADHLARST